MTPVAATKTSLARDEVVGREHALRVDAGVGEPPALVVVARPEPSLDAAADALQRGGGDDAFGRAADAVEHVDAGAAARGRDRRRDVAVADEVHLCPASRSSAIRSSWRSRSSTTMDSSRGVTPFAFATALTFSVGDASMSMTSIASGPTAIFSM